MENRYVISSNPNFREQGFARFDANTPDMPKGAIVDVVTDNNVLTFAQLPKAASSEEYVLKLVGAVPPLPPEIQMGAIVEGGILKKQERFTLRLQSSHLAEQAFRAISIWTNMEIWTI